MPVFNRAGAGRIAYLFAFALLAIYAISVHRTSLTKSVVPESASLRFSVYLVAEGLQAYRDSTGTLPATLEEIGLDEEGIQYRSNGSTYRLVALAGSTSIVYAEGDDTRKYGAAFAVLEGGAVR